MYTTLLTAEGHFRDTAHRDFEGCYCTQVEMVRKAIEHGLPKYLLV